MSDVNPAELRELAARAEALAAAIDAITDRLQTAQDEPTQPSGFRLPDAAGSARRVGAELADTAAEKVKTACA